MSYKLRLAEVLEVVTGSRAALESGERALAAQPAPLREPVAGE